jgi:hypothetical protein
MGSHPDEALRADMRGCIGLDALAKHGRYKLTIIDDARVRLEGM